MQVFNSAFISLKGLSLASPSLHCLRFPYPALPTTNTLILFLKLITPETILLIYLSTCLLSIFTLFHTPEREELLYVLLTAENLTKNPAGKGLSAWKGSIVEILLTL